MKSISPVFISLLLSILICTGSYSTSQAQIDKLVEGYVITLEQDTLYGWIFAGSNQQLSRALKFRSSFGSAYTTYRPSGIAGYGFGTDQTYVSAQIDHPLFQDTVFLRQLIIGTMSLFQTTDQNGKKLFLLKEKQDQWIPLHKNAWKTLLEGALTACDKQEVIKLRKQASYSAKSLSHLIASYNACSSSTKSTILYAKRKGGIKKGIILSIGSPTAAFNYPIEINRTFRTGSYRALGASFRSKVASRLSWRGDILYEQYEFLESIASSLEYYEFEVKASKLAFQGIIQHNFISARSSPYGFLGLELGLRMTDGLRIFNRNASIPEGVWRKRIGLDWGNYFGLMMGLGYLHSIGKNLELFVEGRWKTTFIAYKALRINGPGYMRGFHVAMGVGF